MKAPYLDYLISNAENRPTLIDKKCSGNLISVFSELLALAPHGDDELRRIWLIAERGNINDFGNYEEFLEEGIVENEEQFKEYWLGEYPDETKWYSFFVTKYQGTLYFYIDSKLIFQFQESGKTGKSPECNHELSGWLLATTVDIVNKIKQNLESYNEYIFENLPPQKRFGRILRKDLWSIFPDEKEFFESNLPESKIKIVQKIVQQSNSGDNLLALKTMTAGDFFRYCEMGYDANNCFDGDLQILSPKEKYLNMADGRDCGLRNIDENSVPEFDKWYNHERNCGGHPWEIFRGGNSTHISLFIHKIDEGWLLRLAGSSRGRVVETLKMAIALYENNVPFILEQSQEIYSMVTGSDYIGIVPETIIPVYCHSLFPKEDMIIDFMNLGTENSTEIIKKTYWYPEKKVKLLNP